MIRRTSNLKSTTAPAVGATAASAPPRTGRVLHSLSAAAAPAATPAPTHRGKGTVPPAAPVSRSTRGKAGAVAATANAPAPRGFRPPAFPATARITVIGFDEKGGNPKRPGSQASRAWAAYTDAKGKFVKTVGDAMERFKQLGFPLRYARSALRWDAGHGFIKIEDVKAK